MQEWGTQCGECREHGECSLGFRGISLRIPGNLLILAFRGISRRFGGMSLKTPGNAIKDSGECSRRFWGMLSKIRGNVIKDSGECSRGFRGISLKILRNFGRIPGNVQEDSAESKFRFIS